MAEEKDSAGTGHVVGDLPEPGVEDAGLRTVSKLEGPLDDVVPLIRRQAFHDKRIRCPLYREFQTSGHPEGSTIEPIALPSGFKEGKLNHESHTSEQQRVIARLITLLKLNWTIETTQCVVKQTLHMSRRCHDGAEPSAAEKLWSTTLCGVPTRPFSQETDARDQLPWQRAEQRRCLQC